MMGERLRLPVPNPSPGAKTSTTERATAQGRIDRVCRREYYKQLKGWRANGVVLFAFAVMACNQGEKIFQDGFVDLYVDLKLATVAFSHDHEKAQEARRVILAKHGSQPVEFRRMHERLAANPDAWKDFQEKVIRRLDDRQRTQEGDENGL